MRPTVLAIVSIAFILSSFGARAATRSAGIELESIGAGETVDLGSLLAGSPYTFLVFWQSGCSECIESLSSCQEFAEEYGGGGISVICINYDDTRPRGLEGLLAREGIDIINLYDRYGQAASAFGVRGGTFSIILTVGGEAVSRVDDPAVDAADAMVSMFMEGDAVVEPGGEGGTDPEAQEDARSRLPAWTTGRIDAGAETRVKFLTITTDGDTATGPFGEDIDEGDRMLHRFELSVSARVSKRIELGGLVRVSNEGLEVLRGGPDYFDSGFGSAYAKIEAGAVDLRLGYFSVSMTPLTMMRWDWDDNPRTGGNAGCGCGAVAGVLSSESLELLDRYYRMEGATANYARGDWSASMFYAMPRRARSIRMVETTYGGEEMAAYSLETSGLELGWKRYHERSGSYYEAGLHAVASWEDPRSIDCISLGYSTPFEWYETALVSLTARIPLWSSAALRGELVALNHTTRHGAGSGGVGEEDSEASGGIAGLAVSRGALTTAAVDYIRLPGGFFSPFSAMSYEAGMHGVRVSSVIAYPDERFALQLFFKRMEEIDGETPGLERMSATTTGIALDVELLSGAGASMAFIDDRDSRDGPPGEIDLLRRVYTVSARYRFSRETWIEAQAQRIENTDDSAGSGSWSRTDMASVFVAGSF